MCDQHDFTFEFDKAFEAQVIEKFEASPVHPLTEDVGLPDRGVYGLYLGETVAYVGSALNPNAPLRRRLGEHYRKIVGRRNIEVSDVSCRFLLIENDWFIQAAEAALMRHYDPPWNGSGFGSHVPGRGRPGTRPSRWDVEYPP